MPRRAKDIVGTTTPDELAAALRHAQEQVEQERRRADLAEASARRAWQLAEWRSPRRRNEGDDSAH
jgi:hypothetical protein